MKSAPAAEALIPKPMRLATRPSQTAAGRCGCDVNLGLEADADIGRHRWPRTALSSYLIHIGPVGYARAHAQGRWYRLGHEQSRRGPCTGSSCASADHGQSRSQSFRHYRRRLDTVDPPRSLLRRAPLFRLEGPLKHSAQRPDRPPAAPRRGWRSRRTRRRRGQHTHGIPSH